MTVYHILLKNFISFIQFKKYIYIAPARDADAVSSGALCQKNCGKTEFYFIGHAYFEREYVGKWRCPVPP